ncbi:MAG: acyl-CoA thioesterase [Anaerolineae bacterium]|nr:acyl-CoA thioesterase [Anaerolineae bacterium]
MPPTDRFVSETQFHVRYAETDAMGIVHHASFIVYLEEARSHYARARGANYTDLIDMGYFLTVAEIHARYAAPAKYGQVLVARCWVDDLKSRSVTFGYEVADSSSGVIHVTGQSRHICITHAGQVARIPDVWLNALKEKP